MITKQGFNLIASAIDATLETADCLERDGGPMTAEGALEMLARRLADDLANQNERFDRERFLAACGFPTGEEARP